MAGAGSNGFTVRRISASPDPAPGIREGPEYAKLVDISRCIGCKGCEVACKEWNELGVEPTENFGSFQSHRDLTPDTWLLMRFNEVEVDGEPEWLIKKDACLHCEEPGCSVRMPCPGRDRSVRERDRRLQAGQLYRLSAVRLGMPVRHPPLQLRIRDASTSATCAWTAWRPASSPRA